MSRQVGGAPKTGAPKLSAVAAKSGTFGAKGSRAEVFRQMGMALREYLGAADMYEEAVADRMGLSRTDMRCVDLLERRGTMTAGALAVASGLTTGAVTFLIDRLEARGMVRRRRDPGDRRRVLVEMIESAAKEGFAIHQPMVTDMRALVQRYKMEELGIIFDFLTEARQVYESHAPRLRSRGDA